MVSIAAHHAEWLSLIDVSGPFLSVPVLKDAIPNGLVAHDPQLSAEVRAALEQWDDGVPEFGWADSADVHQALVRFVLERVLGFDPDVLRWDDETLATHTVEVPQWGAIAPDAVIMDGAETLMYVAVHPRDQRVDGPLEGIGVDTPLTRMVALLKASGVRVGLVTDGERWTLVSYRDGENPGFVTWWSSLWAEEKITLQAFRTLLHQDRFLTLGEDETIGALLDRSAEDQSEITTKLGKQTLEAVERLTQALVRVDHERSGDLLRAVEQEKGIAELYDAAVTVMMRLIFLFYAEENDLLPMTEPLYVERYAASSLRERLQAAADEHGEEVLESTSDGWPRLLSTWRAVYGGVEHGDMRLAPYGGSLFDPDRYPFLEGRQPGSTWLKDPANPLKIDNRTVLHLLNALQTLDEGGQRRKLSFRALDVEQIGHVYEGMLDHTAARAKGWVLGLTGTGGKQPEIELGQLELFDNDKALLDFLKDQTGRAPATNKKWITDEEADKAITGFGPTWTAAFGDPEVAERVRTYAKLLRSDSTGGPTAFQPGSVYVADSSHRGATGTHYTPRSLTEEIVKHTLDPLVYDGPDEGKPEDDWVLKTPEEILDLKICDPACGSGAFLVQACRYLAQRLVEARRVAEEVDIGAAEEQRVDARRQVVERCLHGVDVNPMACEMAKLSLWLITLAHDRPFTFLDHAIRCGDSLLGIHDLDQLIHFHIDPTRGRQLHGGTFFDIEEAVTDQTVQASEILEQIASAPSLDLQAIRRKKGLDRQARLALSRLRSVADTIIATHLGLGDTNAYDAIMLDQAPATALILSGTDASAADKDQLDLGAHQSLFHWPIEFPQVFFTGERHGFDALLANPPFMGGQGLTGTFGTNYRRFLVEVIAGGTRGSADLVAYFFLRAASLCNESGRLGMVATNTIAQGDTREVGLDQLVGDGWAIARAVKSRPWPGVATLEIAKLWLTLTESSATSILDNQPVAGITTSLNPRGRVTGTPRRLANNEGIAFQGSNLWGAGFVLDHVEAARITDQDPAELEVIRPYLIGRDLNSDPAQRPSRHVIDFRDWTLDTAGSYRVAMAIVVERVKPARMEIKRARNRQLWWQHAEPRPGLYGAIAGLNRVLAIAAVSKTLMPAFVGGGIVLDKQLCVFAYDDDAHFGLLSSGFHYWWAITHASTMRNDIRYTPSDCFDTFPQPQPTSDLGSAGRQLDEERRSFMLEHDLGLTKTYNRIHDQADTDVQVGRLRQLHVQLDVAVRDAYGWRDLELGHDFHPTDQGTRFTFSPSARTEVLDRLRELNFRRYVSEAENGLHGDDVAHLQTDEAGVLRLVSSL